MPAPRNDDRDPDPGSRWRPLGAGSPEMPVKEVKDLVPAIDRLLGAVIRAIVRKKRMAGAVVAVELVIFAVLLQFRLGLVDVLWRRVGVFIAEQTQ